MAKTALILKYNNDQLSGAETAVEAFFWLDSVLNKMAASSEAN